MVDNTQNGVPLQHNVLEAVTKKLNKYESFLNTNIEDLIA